MSRNRPSKLPQYRGTFGRAQAERLLWRAGMGPRPGEARRLAKLDIDDAVRKLTRPGRERLRGPRPHVEGGAPLAPYSVPLHDHLWWLDRMVRTQRPLVERMTLVWHDWFATTNSEVVVPRLMIEQNQLFRRKGLASFAELLAAVTRDPAMLIWQNGNVNRRDAPNENYAREMMELFSLGAGRGYTEGDVREHARALTGWTNSYDAHGKPDRFWYDPGLHDPGTKAIFGERGRYDWRDSAGLCINHRAHPSFFVDKLWSYFVPTPPSRSTRRGLQRLYRAKGERVRPVVEAILSHPDFYEGPPMVKPPVIYTAGLLRAKRRGIDSIDWAQYGALSGQQLFKPPNVSGWNDDRWLDSGTWLARWQIAAAVIKPFAPTRSAEPTMRPARLVDRALEFWDRPILRQATRGALLDFAQHALRDGRGVSNDATRLQYPALVEHTLRQLIAISPDFQVA